MNSNNITATNGRVFEALTPVLNHIMESGIEEKIKTEVDKSKIYTGVLTKFYPYLDKAEVKINKSNKKVLCKIFHRLGGNLIDFFTPEGEQILCEKLNEPCILPRSEMHVLIANISEEFTKEMLLLGYYFPDEIIGISPASQGEYKISNIGATNMWGFKMSNGDVKISTMEGVNFVEGEFHEENRNIVYADSKDSYTREELYTKSEVDELLEKMKEEIIDELKPKPSPTDNNTDDET